MEEVLRQAPTLQTNAAHLMDSRMRPVRFTAAARAFDNQGWYLGTAGLGLLYLQDAAAIPERMPFGLPANFVGAVMTWPGGLWAATNRTAETDAAFTFVESGLREFRTVHGLPATGTPFNRVIELAGLGKSLWAATDFGLARVDLEEGRIDLFDEGRGLPYSQVFDVAGRQGRIVVGTARGLARLDDSLRVIRIAPQFAEAAYAVFPSGDSVWVGTPRGVFIAVPGEDDLLRPPGLNAASLQAPVYEFATLGDTLVALTRDQLIWRDPRTRGWSLGPNLSGLLGRLRRFAADGPGLLGRGRAGRRLRSARQLGGAAAARWRPPRDRQRPRGGSGASLGGHHGRPRPLPPRRYSAVKPGLVPQHLALGPGAEFDRIRELVRILGDRARGLGDDCALLTDIGGTLALSTDVSVEGVHFRLDWVTPEEAGWRSAAAALSDLAAEGAEPVGLLSAVTVPEGAAEADLGAMTGGIGEAAAAVGAAVLGGDLSSGPGVERHDHGDRPRGASRDACRSPRGRRDLVDRRARRSAGRPGILASRGDADAGGSPLLRASRAEDRGGPLARDPRGPRHARS